MSAAKRDAEFKSLQGVARAALAEFDATGVTDDSPAEILEQALMCLDSDLDVVTDAASLGETTIEPMVFLRIRLALALARHREQFGKLPHFENEDAAEEKAVLS